jgi:dihydrofolate reductase
MLIRSRMSMSADGYVTTPSGWPALTDPAFVPAETHGFPEFRQNLEAALMGRTTFEPAVGNNFWRWPGLQVFVLASERPECQRALPGGSTCTAGPQRPGGAADLCRASLDAWTWIRSAAVVAYLLAA